MKTLKFLLLALLLAAVVTAFTWKSDSKVLAESRQQLQSSCLRTGAAYPDLPPERVESFCTCSTDKIVAALGPKGLRALQSAKRPSDSDKELMSRSSRECFKGIIAG